jgi:hypothetical protein
MRIAVFADRHHACGSGNRTKQERRGPTGYRPLRVRDTLF